MNQEHVGDDNNMTLYLLMPQVVVTHMLIVHGIQYSTYYTTGDIIPGKNRLKSQKFR